MSTTVQVSVRVPAATAERLDRLAQTMAEESPEHRLRPPGRSDAARVALAAGLQVLEEKAAAKAAE